MTPTPCTKPPGWLARMAAALMPPDSREHVIGDLCESYTSPGRFAADVLRSLPFVLSTRIRHTTVFALWPFLGVMLIGFLGVGPGLVWLRGLVPALAVLVGYMLRDAYRVPDPRRRWRQGLVDATVVAGFVAASQILTAWVAPALVMTRVGAVGFIFAMNILTLLRAMNPARNGMPVPQPCAGAVSLLELQREIAWYERTLRRGGQVEIAVCLIMMPVFAAGALLLPESMPRLASTLALVSVSYVAWYVWRLLRVPTVPAGADFAATVDAYRARLERGHDAWRTYWRWYLLPLGLGPALLFGSIVATAPETQRGLMPAIIFVVLWSMLARYGAKNARRLRRRIAELGSLTEAR